MNDVCGKGFTVTFSKYLGVALNIKFLILVGEFVLIKTTKFGQRLQEKTRLSLWHSKTIDC